MTVNNKKEIRVVDSGFDYRPYPYGEYAGQPTVSMKLSSSDNNKTRIGTIDGKFDGWGWNRKINSGFARFRIHGTDPLSDIHIEGIDTLDNIIGPRFVDFELNKQSINQIPSRTVKRIADHFTLFVPLDESFDEEAFEWFVDRSRSYGDVEFIFKVGDYEDDKAVNRISREYKIYDSDIWLLPQGEKLNTAKDSYDKCVNWAKRNSWNVSPRFDLWEQFEVDGEE